MTNMRMVQDIMVALKRHPNVLEKLAERLKQMPSEAQGRRKGVLLSAFDLLELQQRFRLASKGGLRRNAVQMTRDELARGLMLHQPRRKAVLHIDPRTLDRVQNIYRESLIETAADNDSTPSEYDDESSTQSSGSISSDDQQAKALLNGEQFAPPTFDDDELSSLQSYETPSTNSSKGSRGSMGDSESHDGVYRDGFDLLKYLESRARTGGRSGRGGSNDDDDDEDGSFLDDAQYGPSGATTSLDSENDDGDWGWGSNAPPTLGTRLVAEVGGVDTDNLDELPGNYIDTRPDSKGSVLSKTGIEMLDADDADWDEEEEETEGGKEMPKDGDVQETKTEDHKQGKEK
jgi:hypothetical protein